MFSRIFSITVLFLLARNIIAEEMVYITIGSEALQTLSQNKLLIQTLKSNDGVSLVSVPKSQIEKISKIMHEKFNRCGGFIFHPNLEKANDMLFSKGDFNQKSLEYSIGKEETVNLLLNKVEANKIKETIQKLSSFENRYYENKNGTDSQTWLKNTWETLIRGRSDSRVEFFQHSFLQPSVILTIQGSKKPEEIIVLGGHGDSINQSGESSAPGADDNASGIAVLTEIIRVISQENYRPERTIKIISYAAEEVGLRGSNEIAERLKTTKANILGVLQFDMTNFSGTESKIYLISDYTNAGQNTFLTKLIDKYVQIPYAYGKCGYACSDHASWNRSGFIVSFPFEASMRGHNPHIHTTEDTLDKSKNSAIHAMNFAKLGISYLVELDK